MEKLKLLLVFLILISIVTVTQAAPPIQQTEILTNGLKLESPIIEFIKLGEPFKFHIHVYNASTNIIVDNSTTYCLLHLYRPSDGGHIYEGNMSFDSNNIDFERELSGSNFTEVGQHAVLFYCDSEGIDGGFFEYPIMVTKTGSEYTQPIALNFLVLTLFMIIISICLGYLGFKFKNPFITISLITLAILILLFNLGILVSLSDLTFENFTALAGNVESLFLLSMILVGVGFFSLMVYLIVVVLKFYWSMRGMTDKFSIQDL